MQKYITVIFFLILINVVSGQTTDSLKHLLDTSKIIACRTLKEMEQQLGYFDYFIRVHHSWIVNLNEVTKYIRGEGGYLIMSDGTSVNVSRSRKEALMKRF